jgi:hypothetical protein
MRSIAQRPVDNQRYPKSRGENVAEAYGSAAEWRHAHPNAPR